MNVNHGLLSALGVSTSALDQMAHASRRAGALGAKLTGAGGGGCIIALAYEGERVVHGTPSGVDNNISTYGGILRYERAVGFERFKVDAPLPLAIGNTRRRRSTRRMVERVRALRDRNPGVVDGVIDAMGRLSQEGLAALLDGDLPRLGDLMNVNHGLLSALGVSTSALDQMAHASRRAGALGAKLTGAGGGGCIIALAGCIIALAEASNLGRVMEAIRRRRGDAIGVSVAYDGVRTRRVE